MKAFLVVMDHEIGVGLCVEVICDEVFHGAETPRSRVVFVSGADIQHHIQRNERRDWGLFCDDVHSIWKQSFLDPRRRVLYEGVT